MSNKNYVIATIKPWNLEIFEQIIKKLPGKWHLISTPQELCLKTLKNIDPEYIFFPHWSHKVDEEVFSSFQCICFHMTDLPYGRGGSPLQNLIARGHESTMISAIKMTSELDAGPVYMKEPLSLNGLAEEIYIRAARTIARMIEMIITDARDPLPQSGEITVFKRRKPEQSALPVDSESLGDLFNHIRMLDADGYPKAFIELGNLRLEFTRPSLKSAEILADVKISIRKAR